MQNGGGTLPRDRVALRLYHSRGGYGISALYLFFDDFCRRQCRDRRQYGVGEYFIGVVCASAAITLVGIFYPDDGSGVRRALDFCLSLCLLVAVVTPMGGMLKSAGERIDDSAFESLIPKAEIPSGEAASDLLSEESERMIEERIEELVCKSFALDSEKIAVTASVGVTERGVSLETVTVWLSGTALLTDPREIESLIAEYTDAECEIVGGKP